MVSYAFVEPLVPSPSNDTVSGRCVLRNVLPGRCAVHYFSFALGRLIGQAPFTLDFFGVFRKPPSTSNLVSFDPLFVLPRAGLSVLRALPDEEAVEILFVKEGGDDRCVEDQLQDCVMLFAADSRDALVTKFVDDGLSQPCLAVFHTRGVTQANFFFPSIQKVREQLVNEKTLSIPGGIPVQDIVEGRTTKFAVRYMAAVGSTIGAPLTRVCLSEAFFSVLPRPQLPQFRSVPLRHVAVRELAPVMHRQSIRASLETSKASPLSPRGRSGNDVKGNVVAQRLTIIRFPAADVPVPWGSVLVAGGSMLPTTSLITITFSVRDPSFPHPDDKIVVYPQGGTRAVSECAVRYATDARPDLTFGTLQLNPPLLEGAYLAGYYSSRLDVVLFPSDAFRIAAMGEGTAEGGTGSHDDNGPRNRPARPPRKLGGAAQSNYPNDDEDRRSTTPTRRARNDAFKKLQSSSADGPHGRYHSAQQRLPRTKVLIVAVTYHQTPHELKGPENDSQAFAGVAKAFYQRPDDAESCLIRTLDESGSHRPPTFANIVEEFGWLVEGATDGDHLVFYFSGAGSTTIEGCPALVTVDNDWSQGMITADVLLEQLFEKVRPTVAVTLLLDCSFLTNRLEAFRRSELRLMAAGEEDVHIGWNSMLRRRKANGVGLAPWRCVPPPRGATPVDTSAGAPNRPVQAMFGPLFRDPLVQHEALPVHPTGGENCDRLMDALHRCLQQQWPLTVIYEASSGAMNVMDGAWDVFIRETSLTRGLFSHYLGKVLLEETATGTGSGPTSSSSSLFSAGAKDRPLRWLEVHERMLRLFQTMPSYRQRPRLLVASPDAIHHCVRAVSDIPVGN